MTQGSLAAAGRPGDMNGILGGGGGAFGPPGTSGRPGDGIGTITPAPREDNEVLPAANAPRRPSIEPVPSRAPAALPDAGGLPPAVPSLPADVAPNPAAPGELTLPADLPPGVMGQPGALPAPN